MFFRGFRFTHWINAKVLVTAKLQNGALSNRVQIKETYISPQTCFSSLLQAQFFNEHKFSWKDTLSDNRLLNELTLGEQNRTAISVWSPVFYIHKNNNKTNQKQNWLRKPICHFVILDLDTNQNDFLFTI